MTAFGRTLTWPHRARSGATPVLALWRRILWLLRRSICGLMGHDMVKHFEPDRLSLRCLSCGAQTPGWSLDSKAAFARRATVIVHSKWAARQPNRAKESSTRPGRIAAA